MWWRRALSLAAALIIPVLPVWWPVPAEAAAPAPLIVYTYDVRGLGNRSDLASFATQAAETYADPRGWNLGGSIAFRRVSAGGQFTLWLAAASQVPSFGGACDSAWSCEMGRNVVINESRWLGASQMWVQSGRSLRDYRHMVINHETGHWLGLNHHFCGGAGQLAPVMQQQSISLQGCRPNPWPLSWERRQVAASRGVPILSGVPIGHLDMLSAGPLDTLRVRGWALAMTTTSPLPISVYIDAHLYALTANLPRPDVARVYPKYGENHGFAATLKAPSGRHRVCIFAVNPAQNLRTDLGCRDLAFGGSPIGRITVVSAVAGSSGTSTPTSLTVAGWALDPDVTLPVRVHVYVDGVGLSVLAAAYRSDVAAAFPAYGGQHGFTATFGVNPGTHTVCAFALNLAGSGGTTVLGCRSVTT